MSRLPRQPANYDNPWKEILEGYFPNFMAFFFPAAHDDIYNDWVLALPPDLDKIFWEQMNEYEEAKRMPYITSVERIGMERGMAQGMAQGMARALARLLQLKFGSIPEPLTQRLQKMEISRLEELMDVAVQAESLATFEQALELEPA